MSDKRKIEVFTAGCAICDEAVQLVKNLVCPSCEVEVLNTQESKSYKRAELYGIRSLPAVVIDGKLADCCSGRGVDEKVLRNAGIGIPL